MSAALGADERPIRTGDTVRHQNQIRADVQGRVLRTDDRGQAEVESHPGTWWNAHNLLHVEPCIDLDQEADALQWWRSQQ